MRPVAWLMVALCAAHFLLACSDEEAKPNLIFPGAGSGAVGASGASGASGMSGMGGSGGVGASGAAGGMGGATGGVGGPAGGTGGAAGDGMCTTAGMLSYAQDVRPILQRCAECHDDGGDSGFDARSLAGLLAGGSHGPAVTPGDCASSILYQKTGAMPPFGARMPLGGGALSEAERESICTWIDQGAVETVMACPTAGAGGAGGAGGMSASGDVAAPEFDGVDDVEEQADGCTVSWEAAQDDVSSAAAIVYDVYAVAEGAAIDAAMPALTTAPGATSAHVPLASGSDYDIVVQARDEAGNRDGNDRARECSLR